MHKPIKIQTMAQTDDFTIKYPLEKAGKEVDGMTGVPKLGQRVVSKVPSPLFPKGAIGIIKDVRMGFVEVKNESGKVATFDYPSFNTNFTEFPENDPILNEIQLLLDKQVGKGIGSYGAPLSKNPKNLNMLEMLDYLAEELVDALFYNRKLKQMLKEFDGLDYLKSFKPEELAILKRLARKVRAAENGSCEATDV